MTPSTAHAPPTRRTLSAPAHRAAPARSRRRPGTLLALVALLAAGVVVMGPARDEAVQSLRDVAGRSGEAVADGSLPDGPADIDDDAWPAITNLDPALAAAVREATRAAAADGVTLRINSGWRSETYQRHLMDEAVRKYGSAAEARRWVKSPQESTHVTGHAVDIGPTGAAYWTAEHGARYGLCQVYANEIWHYELLTTPGGGCPPLHPDSSS